MASALVLAACGTSDGTTRSAPPTTADLTAEATTTAPTTEADPTQPDTTAPEASRRDLVSCAALDPGSWSAAPTEADLPFEIAAGKAPGLAGGPSGAPASPGVYKTADEFLAQSNVPDPVERKRVMDEAGYRGGVEAEWSGDPTYTMQVLRFADAPSAARYVMARLPSLCGHGGTQDGVTMLRDGDGIMWTDPLGATHGEFIFGGSQVSLTSCGGCAPVSLDELQAWHDEFVAAYAAGPPAPIS